MASISVFHHEFTPYPSSNLWFCSLFLSRLLSNVRVPNSSSSTMPSSTVGSWISRLAAGDFETHPTTHPMTHPSMQSAAAACALILFPFPVGLSSRLPPRVRGSRNHDADRSALPDVQI